MLNLGAYQATKKAFAKLFEEIAAALDLTTGQSQFLLTISGALLAFFVFYQLRSYVRAAPEIPAEETILAAGAPSISSRRLYAVLGLVAGVLCLITGYTFGGYDSSLPALGWLLIPASLLAMWIISLPDGRHKKDEAAESPTEAPHDPLETYAFISFFAGLFILILGLSSLVHALKAERIRETAARNTSAKPKPFMLQPPPVANDPSSPKEVSSEALAKAIESWRKKSSQQPSEKKAGEGPGKEPDAPAQEKPAPAAK
jgi:peptidoglycan/LPS O-acetylase OafA/YrhL